MSDKDDFIEVFMPSRRMYVERIGFDTIRTVHAPLSDEIIDLHMEGHRNISFFSSPARRDYIGVDIDDHIFGGWVGDKPTSVLFERYRKVIDAIGCYPSVSFASRQGIHSYWFINRKIPNDIILIALRDKLEIDIGVEILPRPREALTIPIPSNYLDQNMERKHFIGYHKMIRYEASKIIGDYGNPEKVQEMRRAKGAISSTKRGKSKEQNIEDAESRFFPFQNNQTNEAYCQLVAIYKANGLSVEEACQRFAKLSSTSLGYSGAILVNLQTRVECSYRRMKGTMAPDIESLVKLKRLDGVNAMLEFLAVESGIETKTRSRLALEDFVLRILGWCRYLDKVFSNAESAAYWGYIYRDSRDFHKKGYYPLSFKLMKQWNSHYNRKVNLLVQLGVLVESPRGYSTTLKRCKYYAFNLLSCRVSHSPISHIEIE